MEKKLVLFTTLNVNFESMDLRTEIENIVHEILMEGVTKEDAVKELFNLHNVVCSATKCMACEVEIKKDEGILFCGDCGM